MDNNGRYKLLIVKIEEEKHRALKMLAAKTGKSIQTIINAWLEQMQPN